MSEGGWGVPLTVAYPIMYLMRFFMRLLISAELLFDLNSFSITMKRVILIMTRLIQVSPENILLSIVMKLEKLFGNCLLW